MDKRNEGANMNIPYNLIRDLKDALAALDGIHARRDAMTREANELMIQEHNIQAHIQRINIDIVTYATREG